MAKRAGLKRPSGFRRSWKGGISRLGVGAAVVGAALATFVGRATGAGWLPAVGLAILLGAGLYLWARDEEKGWGDLGEGIMVSVIVAIALMAVQRDADDRTRDADVRREQQIREAEAARQKAAERENLQLSLTMQTDLRGIALAERDLHGFFLARKNFAGADLHGANLEGADLRRSEFRLTNLLGANLDDARMRRADLRQAVLSSYGGGRPDPGSIVPTDRYSTSTSMRGANLEDVDLRNLDLTGVDFTGAVLIHADVRRALLGGHPAPVRFQDAALIYTDFRGAIFGSADLRGARLGGAQFCGTLGLQQVKLDGAIYDETTRWPPGFNPKTHGAKKALRGEAMTLKLGNLSVPAFPGGYRARACSR